jgi:hypothetical protein
LSTVTKDKMTLKKTLIQNGRSISVIDFFLFYLINITFKNLEKKSLLADLFPELGIDDYEFQDNLNFSIEKIKNTRNEWLQYKLKCILV